MKTCPFCAEAIQDDAVKCRYCGEFLDKSMKVSPKDPWYFKASFIIGTFCLVGPFALPLVWMHPRYSLKAKVITSVIALVITYYLTVTLTHAIKNILEYYHQVGMIH